MRRRTRLPSFLLCVAFVAAWWLLLAPPSLGGRTSYISVSGKSMEPTYVTGDLVVVREQGSYRPGDIVAFNADGGVVIHRIVDGDGDAGYVLQGDNNSWRDPWNPTDDDVVGRAWFRMPGASRWLLTLTHPVVLAVVVTGALAWMLMPTKPKTRPSGHSKKQTPHPAATPRPTRSAMELADLRRAFASVPRRTITAAALAFGVGLLLAVPAVLAWLDDTERTSFLESARTRESADFTYTFHLDRTTLYPEGTVGPIDSNAPPPPTVFALPARTLDVTVDYAFDGATAEASGTYAVDATLVSDAGWTTPVPLVPSTPFSGTQARADVAIDLASFIALAEQVDEESGTASRSIQVQVQPRFDLSTTVDGEPVRETFAPPFTVVHEGTTWKVATPLVAEEVRQFGVEVTDQVELAGVPVEQLRWLAVPAILLMTGAIAMITVALRRTPVLTVDALLRRPGISVIDLEQPPADAALAVPLASAEGIRRVAERDGGLVLRFDEGDHVHLYARHDDRVYRYTPEASSR